MRMNNPPYPGEFIWEVYLMPFKISTRRIAAQLKVAPDYLFRTGKNGESSCNG